MDNDSNSLIDVLAAKIIGFNQATREKKLESSLPETIHFLANWSIYDQDKIYIPSTFLKTSSKTSETPIFGSLDMYSLDVENTTNYPYLKIKPVLRLTGYDQIQKTYCYAIESVLTRIKDEDNNTFMYKGRAAITIAYNQYSNSTAFFDMNSINYSYLPEYIIPNSTDNLYQPFFGNYIFLEIVLRQYNYETNYFNALNDPNSNKITVDKLPTWNLNVFLKVANSENDSRNIVDYYIPINKSGDFKTIVDSLRNNIVISNSGKPKLINNMQIILPDVEIEKTGSLDNSPKNVVAKEFQNPEVLTSRESFINQFVFPDFMYNNFESNALITSENIIGPPSPPYDSPAIRYLDLDEKYLAYSKGMFISDVQTDTQIIPQPVKINVNVKMDIVADFKFEPQFDQNGLMALYPKINAFLFFPGSKKTDKNYTIVNSSSKPIGLPPFNPAPSKSSNSKNKTLKAKRPPKSRTPSKGANATGGANSGSKLRSTKKITPHSSATNTVLNGSLAPTSSTGLNPTGQAPITATSNTSSISSSSTVVSISSLTNSPSLPLLGSPLIGVSSYASTASTTSTTGINTGNGGSSASISELQTKINIQSWVDDATQNVDSISKNQEYVVNSINQLKNIMLYATGIEDTNIKEPADKEVVYLTNLIDKIQSSRINDPVQLKSVMLSTIIGHGKMPS